MEKTNGGCYNIYVNIERRLALCYFWWSRRTWSIKLRC